MVDNSKRFKTYLALSLLKWMDSNGFSNESKVRLLDVTKGNPSLMYDSLVTAGLDSNNWDCGEVFDWFSASHNYTN